MAPRRMVAGMSDWQIVVLCVAVIPASLVLLAYGFMNVGDWLGQKLWTIWIGRIRMSNEMREAFNTWWKNGGHRMGCGGIEAGIVWDAAWQAATTATQLDAMAVAEAVAIACADAIGKFKKAAIDCGDIKSKEAANCLTSSIVAGINLAAIVEAVRPSKPELVTPSKPESVNGKLLAALKAVMEGCEYKTIMGVEGWHKISMPKQSSLDLGRAAIAAAEAAQPASAQQQGDDRLPVLSTEAANAELPTFKQWWEDHGQFVRAGGGQYESCFAWSAWQAAIVPCRTTPDAQMQGEPVAWKAVHQNGPYPAFTDNKLVAEAWRSIGWDVTPLGPILTALACGLPDDGRLLAAYQSGFNAAQTWDAHSHGLRAVYALAAAPQPSGNSGELLAAVAVPDEATGERVRVAIVEALGDAYDCTRVWSSWGAGTMGPGDFSLVAEDDERVAEIADAAIKAMLAAAPNPKGGA